MWRVINRFLPNYCLIANVLWHMNIWITQLTRHAQTLKEAILVQASAFVEARVAVALIDIVLTPEIHGG